MVTVTVRFDVFVTALTLHCEFNSDNLVVTRGGGGISVCDKLATSQHLNAAKFCLFFCFPSVHC
jgi:hypothetical protein